MRQEFIFTIVAGVIILLLVGITQGSNYVSNAFTDGTTAFNLTSDTTKYVMLGYNATVMGANLSVKGHQNISLNSAYNVTTFLGHWIDLIPNTDEFYTSYNFGILKISKMNKTGGKISTRELNSSCGPATMTLTGADLGDVHAVNDEVLYLVVDGFSTVYTYLVKINYTELETGDNTKACLDRIDFRKKLNITEPAGLYVNDDQSWAYVTNDDSSNRYIYEINMSECSNTNDCVSSENYSITRTASSLYYLSLDSVNDGLNFYAVNNAQTYLLYLDSSYSVLDSFLIDKTSLIDGTDMDQIYGLAINNTKFWTLDTTNDDDLSVWDLEFPKDVEIYAGGVKVFDHSGPLKYANESIDLGVSGIESYLVDHNKLNITFYASSWLRSLEVYDLDIEGQSQLNVRLYDEQTYDLLTQNAYIELYKNGYGQNYTVGSGQLNVTSLDFGEYEIRYWATEYARRSYFFTMNDSGVVKADLFLLNSSPTNNAYKAVEVVDESGNSLSDATVKMQRRYSECNGCFKTVEMTRTDETGASYLFTELYDATYKFVIEYGGLTKKITNATTLDTRTLYFKINTQDAGIDSFFDVIVGVTGDVGRLDDTVNVWSYTYNDVNNANVESGRLVVKRKSTYTDTNICDVSMTGSSGTLTCNQSSYVNTTGQFFAQGYVTTSDGVEHLMDTESFAYVYDYLTYGLTGVLLSAILIGVIAMIGLWSPVASIVMVLFGLVIAVAVGLLYIQLTWLIGAAVVGIIFIGHMKK